MKKVLAMVMVLTMLACTFAVNVAAVDNYEPKTINLIANTDGTCSLPDGYVVYIGDTLVFPRGEVVFIDDLKIRNSTEIREMAVGILNDIMVEVNGVMIGQSWSDDLTLTNAAAKDSNKYWFDFDNGADIEVAGTFVFYAYSAHDAAWTEQYLIEPMAKLLTIDVVDPKTVDTIVAPPAADVPADEPADEPTTDTPADEPTTDTPADEPTTDAPTTDTPADEPTTDVPADDKTDDTADVDAPANNTLIYAIVAVVAVAVVVVVIVLVSKKKK